MILTCLIALYELSSWSFLHGSQKVLFWVWRGLRRFISVVEKDGNVEIGNGYGVPGGGAYYGASRPETISSGNNGNEKQEPSQNISEQNKQKPNNTSDLPDYLKQKLKARGILKDESDNKLKNQSPELIAPSTLPSGWIESRDPTSGCIFYYNEKSGKSRWEKPVATSLNSQTPSPSNLLEDWQEGGWIERGSAAGCGYYCNGSFVSANTVSITGCGVKEECGNCFTEEEAGG